MHDFGPPVLLNDVVDDEGDEECGEHGVDLRKHSLPSFGVVATVLVN